MRRASIRATAVFGLVTIAACIPDSTPSHSGTVVDAITAVSAPGGDAPSSAGGDGTSTLPAYAENGAALLRGSVNGSGDYRLFELGPGVAGDEWTVALVGATSADGPFTVVVLDADQRLLQRAVISDQVSLAHVVRVESPTLFVGIMPSYGSYGGEFECRARLHGGIAVPPPRSQLVYVNFNAGSEVKIHVRPGISYPVFDAGMLGPAYAGRSPEMKAAIVQAMRADYAGYEVVVTSSDDGPPPAEPHATIYVGGRDPGLLGLADSVDQYNLDPAQAAIVYVGGFADFADMKLDLDDLASMIANVASHELGHLLGLYHTRDPRDLMDTTGSAWDLAGDQRFTVAPLEPTVFPVGLEDSPRLLEQTVGRIGQSSKTVVAQPRSAEKRQREALLRTLITGELRSRCGNCLDPDH